MSDYHAYLIRLWRDETQQPWRAELVSPHTGEARRFATPEQAFSYVQEQIAETTAGPACPNPSQELV
ncbi:MAG: hypothetical protein WA040_10000 [Anaerolineae bacterium]